MYNTTADNSIAHYAHTHTTHTNTHTYTHTLHIQTHTHTHTLHVQNTHTHTTRTNTHTHTQRTYINILMLILLFICFSYYSHKTWYPYQHRLLEACTTCPEKEASSTKTWLPETSSKSIQTASTLYQHLSMYKTHIGTIS